MEHISCPLCEAKISDMEMQFYKKCKDCHFGRRCSFCNGGLCGELFYNGVTGSSALCLQFNSPKRPLEESVEPSAKRQR